MITTTFKDGFLYMVGRYTVIPGNRNCEWSAVSTDYTVKPGIENCCIKKKKKIINTGIQYTVALSIGFFFFGKVDAIRSLHCFQL
jgi:hypothetical protein